jgi:hypothetical protein
LVIKPLTWRIKMKQLPSARDLVSQVANGWYLVTVTAAGPVENGGVQLFVKGEGIDDWVYAPPLIALSVNQTAISCISGGRQARLEISSVKTPNEIQKLLMLS